MDKWNNSLEFSEYCEHVVNELDKNKYTKISDQRKNQFRIFMELAQSIMDINFYFMYIYKDLDPVELDIPKSSFFLSYILEADMVPNFHATTSDIPLHILEKYCT